MQIGGWRAFLSEGWATMKHAALKIAALFSYCGGPLFISGLLKPGLGVLPAFLVTFLPVGLMLLGALCLDYETQDSLTRAAVRAGRVGLCAALGMHLYTLWRFMEGVRVSEQSLYYLGIAVGMAWSVAYLRAARRWAPSSAVDHDSTEPIEPS